MHKYIYRYTDPARNEVIYIGQGSKTIDFRRAFSHLKRKDKHPFTQRLQKMAREGVQPIIEILIEGIDKELADLIETEAIDKYGRKDLGKGPLLNLTNGGEGRNGSKASIETREKMRIAHLGKGMPMSDEQRALLKDQWKNDEQRRLDLSIRMTISNPQTGKSRTDEQKAKVSAKLKGVPKPEGFSQAISAALKGRPSNAKGKKWWYHPEKKITMLSVEKPNSEWLPGRGEK